MANELDGTGTNSQFDSGLNDLYHDKYNQQSSIVADIAGGAVASVADFGASVWNSLPGTDYVGTEDILSRVSDNALRVYEEHPDAVHAASFIGGMFVPTGLALKGMGMARAGVKGVNWFSNAGKAEDLAKIDRLFVEGQAATSEYRAAKTAFYARGVANQITDAAAMEFALVGSMSAHPLMEDYVKDPVKNFGIGIALGGVIGSGVGHIADRFAVGRLEKAAEGSIVQSLNKDLTIVHPAEQFADQVITHQANIGTLEKIIADKTAAGRVEANDLSVQVANRYLLSVKDAQNKAFESMLSPELLAATKANPDVRNAMLNMVINEDFMGANELSYLTQKMDGGGSVLNMGAGKGSLTDLLTFGSKSTKFIDPATGVQTTKNSLDSVAYSPEFGRFYSIGDLRHYGRARDLNRGVDSLVKEVADTRIPNLNIAEETLSMNSSAIDAYYLGALKKVDDMSVKQVKDIVLSSDDLPMRNAILARIAKEPDEFLNHKWKVTDNKPSFEAFNQQVIVSQASNGVKATHLSDLTKFTTPEQMASKYDTHTLASGYNMDVRDALDGWIRGDKKQLSAAMEDWRLGRDPNGLGSQVYNAPTSVALREEFAKNADNDGYVYLYRGLTKGKASGHGVLDSYTTDVRKAGEFGTPKLYRVKVDDIVTGVVDKIGAAKNEILVRAATLDSHASPATLPIVSAGQAKSVTTKVGNSIATHDANTLSQELIDGKDSTISTMLNQGIPLETIAIRTNTPLDTVKVFATMPEGSSVVDVLNGVGHAEYNSASRISQYMDPTKRTLKIGSDVNKKTFSDLTANLDGANKFNMHNEITSAILAGSGSAAARDLGNYYFSAERMPLLGMIRAKLGEFVNGGSGNRFLTSSEHFSRNMGDVGMIVNTMGKDIVKKTNNAIDAVLVPLNNAYAGMVKNPVALAEYNTAVNVNASIQGWRKFENGQFWTKVAAQDAEGNAVTTLQPVLFQGKEFKVVSPEVHDIFAAHQVAGRELYEMKASINSILGKPAMSDIGLWLPAFNPKNKFIAYVHNKVDDTTRLLWGNTAEELMSAKNAYEATVDPARLGKEINVVMKSDQAIWNTLNGRLDPLTMQIANIQMQHSGSSAGAIVKANTDILGEIAGGYEHYIGSHMRQIAEVSMHDIMDGLTRMSQYNMRLTEGQALSPVAKMLYAPKDTANVIKNTMLGNTNLNEYSSWRQINQSFETGLSMTMTKVGQIFNEAVKPFIPTGLFRRNKELDASVLARVDYETLAKKMEEAGAVNPWASFDDSAAKVFGLAKLTDSKDTSKRIIYASNALAATIALRVGELAQPIVNAMSLPILTSLAVADKMPETFMGIQKATSKVGGVQVMYEGARAMHDPKFDSLRTLWKELGYFDPHISEANNTLKLARTFDRGAITAVENALDSNLVRILSKPADWSESLVRAQTMHTGAVLAKRMYPELDDAGVTIFARDFMDRAVGNYHSAQRPVFFQGTMGVALGLFQTYMLTLGQNIYRHLELKNYKAIGKAALAQQTIFGAASMPGFNQISEMIGEHFSDHNIDLTTGTYRAVGDRTADAILYGLPSSMGPAFYTRGEIAPRVPNPLGGLQNLAGVSFVTQTVDMVNHVAQSIRAENPDIARTLGEALSLQSMSRPLARLSEVATGYSVTRKGNTVAVPEDVWTPMGVMSRILGTRPLEETKVRQAMHLNTLYGSIDHDARQELQIKLKTAIRGGNLSDELTSKYAEEYMRKGGTPTGWRSAVNTALAQTDMTGKDSLAHKLRPDNALNYMIDNLD